MSKILKLFLLFVLVALATGAAFPSGSCPQALAIALHTPCVRAAITPYRPPAYIQGVTVTDNGNGTAVVAFSFTPSCYYNPVPCLRPTVLVSTTVDCNTRTATCP